VSLFFFLGVKKIGNINFLTQQVAAAQPTTGY